ncbi:MAG TPA: MarR family transcriptional regulator [Saprospiraceae bacterium]|nr:MarR family transcriptional regulator [Saprospiraceae bacterium]
MNIPAKTVFFTIEKTIKTYRKFSQKNISSVVSDITIDQKLVLQYLDSNPDLNQKQIEYLVFKDKASMTRIINNMVDKDYLKRRVNEEDRRSFKIEISVKGKEVLKKLPPVIMSNRKRAFAGISEEELIQLERTLNKILSNLNQ